MNGQEKIPLLYSLMILLPCQAPNRVDLVPVVEKRIAFGFPMSRIMRKVELSGRRGHGESSSFENLVTQVASC